MNTEANEIDVQRRDRIALVGRILAETPAWDFEHELFDARYSPQVWEIREIERLLVAELRSLSESATLYADAIERGVQPMHTITSRADDIRILRVRLDERIAILRPMIAAILEGDDA